MLNRLAQLAGRRLTACPQYFQFAKHHIPFSEQYLEYSPELSPAQQTQKIKTFRVIDLQGNVIAPKYDVIDQNILKKIFDTMVTCEEMDTILNMAQRQGKISFYMPAFGEYATTVGVGAGLEFEDLIFPQYREVGTIIWRGFTMQELANQCAGNSKDNCTQGRQMPMHFGSSKLNCVTVSSPLTTQVPQASGAGYAMRLKNENKLAATYFGEGAASEGDFHSALNFAATLRSQTLFLCRNNHWAISTPIVDQFKGDGIAGRGISYGINSYRVDGNDALAVYHVVKQARKFVVEKKEPALIEFMTYRIGDHSTSDHSALYRTQEEIESWKKLNNPIKRLAAYLKKKGLIQENHEENIRKQAKQDVIKCLHNATQEKLPPWENLFSDVYDVVPTHLKAQKEELREHLQKYQDHYHLSKYAEFK